MAAPIRVSLFEACPDIEKYLVSDIDPKTVSSTGRKKYQFVCKKCNEVFERSAGDYVRGTGLCIKCARDYRASKQAVTRADNNSLLRWFISSNMDIPEVVGDYDLSSISAGSSKKKIRFRCKLGHEFEMTPYMVSKGFWCPFCARNKRISKPALCIYMFLREYRKCVLEYTIPGTKLSLDIFIDNMNIGIEFDGQRYHKDIDRELTKDRICEDLGITVLHIREPECPSMCGTNVYTLKNTVSSWKDLDECRYWLVCKLKVNIPLLSFEQAWKDMYVYLYNGMVPNNAYTAICRCQDNDILISSRQRAESISRGENTIKLEFKCRNCGYRYSVTPSNYIRRNSRCPYCAGKAVNNDNSLSSSCIVGEYSALNEEPAENIHIRSSKKCIWTCPSGHYYEATPEARTTRQETGCPICARNVTLSGYNDLETYYPVMYRMIKNNKECLNINSKKILIFRCEVCGCEFEQSPINMHKRIHYCPEWRKHEVDVKYIEQERGERR